MPGTSAKPKLLLLQLSPLGNALDAKLAQMGTRFCATSASAGTGVYMVSGSQHPHSDFHLACCSRVEHCGSSFRYSAYTAAARSQTLEAMQRLPTWLAAVTAEPLQAVP